MTLVTDLLGLEPEDKTLEFFLKSYNKRVPEIFFASAFPRLPVRQWVLSVPKRLRYFMQRDGAVLSMVLRIFLRVIAQSLQTDLAPVSCSS